MISTILGQGSAAYSSQSSAAFGAAKTAGASATAQNDSTSARGDDPATIVDLSDRAKAILDRAKVEETVADRLKQMLTGPADDTGSGKDNKITFEDLIGARSGRGTDPAGEARANEIMAKYGDLPQAEQWAANARADNLGMLEDGLNGFDLNRMEDLARTMRSGQEVRLGQETMTEDEQFVQSIQLRLGSEIVDLDAAGMTDKAQALRDAIRTGSINVQKTDDVPELNLRYTVTHFADAGGGGTRGDWDWRPKGEAKAALDERRAIAIGGVDRGAFFISW